MRFLNGMVLASRSGSAEVFRICWRFIIAACSSVPLLLLLGAEVEADVDGLVALGVLDVVVVGFGVRVEDESTCSFQNLV